jgi:hypothetical protein
MQSDFRLLSKQYRFVIAGLLAMAAGVAPAQSTSGDTYTWSAELVAVDEPARAVTVQAWVVNDAGIKWNDLAAGDRVTLTWSGINTAAGVRRIVEGPAPADDRLTLPIEFVSSEHDNRYVRFKVAVSAADIAKIASLSPGTWITATSPRRATRYEEAVAAVRPYNDVR